MTGPSLTQTASWSKAFQLSYRRLHGDRIRLRKNRYFPKRMLLLAAHLTQGPSWGMSMVGEGTEAPPSSPSSSLPFLTTNQSVSCTM